MSKSRGVVARAATSPPHVTLEFVREKSERLRALRDRVERRELRRKAATKEYADDVDVCVKHVAPSSGAAALPKVRRAYSPLLARGSD